jgi:hypothetical protein
MERQTHYRAVAVLLRQRAALQSSPKMRKQTMDLAADYEKLAAQAESLAIGNEGKRQSRE